MDFSMSGLGYDANGNITAMNQRGVNVNTPLTIDSLIYTNFTNSNQLQKVKDLSTNTANLGDFADTTFTGDDYVYDVNGNQTKDNNKHIHTSGGNGITYNFLDKPDNIIVNGKGSIAYTYDATGVVLQKTITDTKLSLGILTGVGEWIAGGAEDFFSEGTTTSLSIPLFTDGGVRIVTNYSRLITALAGNSELENLPTNSGGLVGKSIGMAAGRSFYDYGYGQAILGSVDDFGSFIVGGGSIDGYSKLMTDGPTYENVYTITVTASTYMYGLYDDYIPLNH